MCICIHFFLLSNTLTPYSPCLTFDPCSWQRPWGTLQITLIPVHSSSPSPYYQSSVWCCVITAKTRMSAPTFQEYTGITHALPNDSIIWHYVTPHMWWILWIISPFFSSYSSPQLTNGNHHNLSWAQSIMAINQLSPYVLFSHLIRHSFAF